MQRKKNCGIAFTWGQLVHQNMSNQKRYFRYSAAKFLRQNYIQIWNEMQSSSSFFLPQNKTQTKKGYTKQRRKKKEEKRGWEPHEEAIRFIISGFLAKKTEDKKNCLRTWQLMKIYIGWKMPSIYMGGRFTKFEGYNKSANFTNFKWQLKLQKAVLIFLSWVWSLNMTMVMPCFLHIIFGFVDHNLN